MILKFIERFAFALLIIVASTPEGAVAQVDHSMSTCVSVDSSVHCSQGAGSYNGPMGGGLSPARMEAYRYSQTSKYEQEMAAAQREIEAMAQREAELRNYSEAEAEAFRKSLQQSFYDQFRPLPRELPLSPEARERLNPTPRHGISPYVSQVSDEIWEGVQRSAPLDVADSIRGVLDYYGNIDYLPVAVQEILVEERDHLLTDLVLSQVLNSEGVLDAPFSESLELYLFTRPFSKGGVRVRQGLNEISALKSLSNSVCGSEIRDLKACEHLQQELEALELSYYSLDRWAQSLGGTHFSEDLGAAADLMDSSLAALRGFTVGLVNGAGSAVTGIYQMIAHPIDTVTALATAVVNYRATLAAIDGAIETTWHDFVNGNLEKKSEMLGALSFEVLSAVVPVSKVSWAAKALTSNHRIRAGVEAGTASRYVAKSDDLVPQLPKGTHQVQLRRDVDIVQSGRNMGLRTQDEFADLGRILDDLNIMDPRAVNGIGTAVGDFARAERAAPLAVMTEISPMLQNMDRSQRVRGLFRGADANAMASAALNRQSAYIQAFPNDSPVLSLTAGNKVYGRAYVQGTNNTGRFLGSPEVWNGLSSGQIKELLQLPLSPTHVEFLRMPANAPVLKGLIKDSSQNGARRNTYQYVLVDSTTEAAKSRLSRPIGDVLQLRESDLR